MNTEQIMPLAEAYAVATSMTLAEPSLKRLSDAATAKAALQNAIKALPELSGNSEQLHELEALKTKLHEVSLDWQVMVQERDAAQADALEQARLCGMGGEREADLLGKVARLERERDAYKVDRDIWQQAALYRAVERDALKTELEDERTRGLQLLADAKEWQQQFIGAQAEVRELRVEVKTLRDALNNCEDALMNSQTVINKDSVGFAKVCREANEMALGIARAALGETK